MLQRRCAYFFCFGVPYSGVQMEINERSPSPISPTRHRIGAGFPSTYTETEDEAAPSDEVAPAAVKGLTGMMARKWNSFFLPHHN